MKESVEELLSKRDFVNLERKKDGVKAMSVRSGSEIYEAFKQLIPIKELSRQFFLFCFEKRGIEGKHSIAFLQAYDSVSNIIDDGWIRSDLN